MEGVHWADELAAVPGLDITAEHSDSDAAAHRPACSAALGAPLRPCRTTPRGPCAPTGSGGGGRCGPGPTPAGGRSRPSAVYSPDSDDVVDGAQALRSDGREIKDERFGQFVVKFYTNVHWRFSTPGSLPDRGCRARNCWRRNCSREQAWNWKVSGSDMSARTSGNGSTPCVPVMPSTARAISPSPGRNIRIRVGRCPLRRCRLAHRGKRRRRRRLGRLPWPEAADVSGTTRPGPAATCPHACLMPFETRPAVIRGPQENIAEQENKKFKHWVVVKFYKCMIISALLKSSRPW